MRNRRSTSFCSRTEVGSSSRMVTWPLMRVLRESALAISTIWRAAKERSAQRMPGSMSRWTFFSSSRCGGLHARLGDEAEAEELLLAAEEDVFGHRQRRQDRLFLKHHGDAGIEGLARRGDADRPAIDEDAAGIGLVDAVEDLEQRRLARAILADEPHDLAAVDVEADVIQRLHARKGLGDAADLEDGCAHLTTSSRERSSARATAAMMRMPCTPFCT